MADFFARAEALQTIKNETVRWMEVSTLLAELRERQLALAYTCKILIMATDPEKRDAVRENLNEMGFAFGEEHFIHAEDQIRDVTSRVDG